MSHLTVQLHAACLSALWEATPEIWRRKAGTPGSRGHLIWWWQAHLLPAVPQHRSRHFPDGSGVKVFGVFIFLLLPSITMNLLRLVYDIWGVVPYLSTAVL